MRRCGMSRERSTSSDERVHSGCHFTPLAYRISRRDCVFQFTDEGYCFAVSSDMSDPVVESQLRVQFGGNLNVSDVTESRPGEFDT